MTKFVTRFAPSPTGKIHLGNLRTALFSWIVAKSQGGKFLIRIEDTDTERSKKHLSEAIIKDLEWLGITSDFDITYQSERNKIYDYYYEYLIEEGYAYKCFCTQEQLALERKVQLASGNAPKYSRKCLNMTKEEIKEKELVGYTSALRFKVDDNAKIEFADKIKGTQAFYGKNIGDFVIRKSDGGASFMFCNAVDDALMGVNLVLRGEDHLSNTPRQLMILDKLNLEAPGYGHFPLITDIDGSPLSKRKGSCSIENLRNDGFHPLAIVNYFARLGHTYKDSLEKVAGVNRKSLIDNFNLSNISTSAAKFDEKQLYYWQKEVVNSLSVPEFKEFVYSHINSDLELTDDFVHLIKANIVWPYELVTWHDIMVKNKIDYSNSTIDFKEVEADFFDICYKSVMDNNNFPDIINALKNTTEKSKKQLFKLLRWALTGLSYGPEIGKIITFLTQEQLEDRFYKAKNYAANL